METFEFKSAKQEELFKSIIDQLGMEVEVVDGHYGLLDWKEIELGGNLAYYISQHF